MNIKRVDKAMASRGDKTPLDEALAVKVSGDAAATHASNRTLAVVKASNAPEAEAPAPDDGSVSEINLKVALAFAEAGMPVLPVKLARTPNGQWSKQPAIRGWQENASTDVTQIRDWWNQFPDAVPGLHLGPVGIVVIDADRHDPGADGVAAFGALTASRAKETPHPQTFSPGLGEHHYYRQPPDEQLGNAEGALPPGINVRGAGGFVVAPGAVRPDGAIWEPAPDAPELTRAFRAGLISGIPPWLVEILRPRTHRLQGPSTSTISRGQAFATAALNACVAELEATNPGRRNNQLNAVAYRLGRMVARGWTDRQLVASRLFGACERNRLVSDDGADSVRDTIDSGLNAGLAHPHGDLSDNHHVAVAEIAEAPPLIPVVWEGEGSVSRTRWLVKDIIPVAATGLLVGESRAGKTLVAIDLARALSSGGEFFTKRARQGGTLYIAAEASGTIPGRLRAARLGPLVPFLDDTGREKSTGEEPRNLAVAMVRNPPDLLTEDGRKSLTATALEVSKNMEAKFGVPLRLIVVDTMLAAFDIADWNDPAQTRRVMNVLSKLADETGAVVLGIHHHGKDVSRGAAGSYALTAAADFIVSVFADADNDGLVLARRISVTKLRDDQTGWSSGFELKGVAIGVDDEGEDIMSAFVVPKVTTAGFGRLARGTKKKKTQSDSMTAFLAALVETRERASLERPAPGPATTIPAVKLSDVKASFARRYRPKAGAKNLPDAQRVAFARAMEAALSEGLVTKDTSDGTEWLFEVDES